MPGSIPPEQSVFGQIAPGFVPASIIIDGRVEELPARPGFRISPDMIPPGRSAIQFWAKAMDGTLGGPFVLRVNRSLRGEERRLYSRPSPIVITTHKAYDYVRNDTISIQGRIAQQKLSASGGSLNLSNLEALAGMVDISAMAGLLGNGEGDENAEPTVLDEVSYAALVEYGGPFELEYRLDPRDSWSPVAIQPNGSFDLLADIGDFPEGLIHLELRTAQQKLPAIPLYLPLNLARSEPEIVFISPIPDGPPATGFMTVSGRVNSYVPITAIEYTTGNGVYTPLEIKAGFQRYEFSILFDFTPMAKAGGSFSIRATDKNGASFISPLNVPVDIDTDNPVITFNQPRGNQLVTGDLVISGTARDDDGVRGIYWRIIRNEETPAAVARIFAGEADGGEPALSRDFAFIPTQDFFRITIPPERLLDGEWRIEIFAEDIYGNQGEMAARIIRISTENPRIALTVPSDQRSVDQEGTLAYNRGVMYLRGTASDKNGIQEVSMSMDNGNTFQRAEGTEDWRLSLNTNFYEDGDYTLLLRARDGFGQETISTVLIHIDNTPPQLVVPVPHDNANVGNTLDVAARILDTVKLREASLELRGIAGSAYQKSFTLDTTVPVVQESLDISDVPDGVYNIRIAATDMAGNTAVISRNINKSTLETNPEAAFYNPLPGEVHTGAVNISGKARGNAINGEVQILANGEPLARVPVDAYGNFYYEYPRGMVPRDGNITLAASFETPSGQTVRSNEHPLFYREAGPVVSVDSHHDGDFVSGRPWLTGRAGMGFSQDQQFFLSGKELRNYVVSQVLVSVDNGRTFRRAEGKENWKFPLECGELGQGPLPILVRAEFANGETAIRRVLVIVDATPPRLMIIAPEEGSLQRHSFRVYGTAGDEYGIDSIMIDLRPGK
jgi:hypothetical protein